MSASYPYAPVAFPSPLDKFGSALMEIELTVANPKDSSKKVNLVFTFDTGASISMGPKSLASQLGLTWESGVPLKLQGVGGAQFDTYVHVLKATIQGNVLSFPPMLMERVQQSRAMLWYKTFREQIGNLVEFDLPIAIADGEDFEFLLGMLGTIDGVGEFRCDNSARRLFFKEKATRLLPNITGLRRV